LTVLEHILVGLAGGELLGNDGLDPLLGLLVHLGIALAGNLGGSDKKKFIF